MAKQIINIGSQANDRSGDPLRTAFDKINQNFTELYTTASLDIQIPAQSGNVGKYLTTNGSELSWATVSGDGASTGDLVFDVNNVYMTNLDESMYLSVERTDGGQSRLALEAGDLSNTKLQGVYDVDITSNAAGITNTWTFDRNGNLTLPGPINQTGSYTNTKGYGLTTPSQVVWSGSYDHISSVKLTIQVEADETGDATGWHSQACEAIIASRGYGNGTYGYGDPIMTVYGVTYTSTAPLVTFTVQRNATTHLIELVATKTAAAGSNAQIQIHSVEMGTSD